MILYINTVRLMKRIRRRQLRYRTRGKPMTEAVKKKKKKLKKMNIGTVKEKR